MSFFKKAKGAVSIFLVIILVPMMTVSSAFVDAGKVKLGSAMAESAGDLALNTALTNYDTDLKDLYGLMATAQDTSDLFLKLEDYYTTCLTSAGVSEEDSIYYVKQMMSSLSQVAETNDVADIMNMQVVDFVVNKPDDANLANATIMKKQIVEFMKYRAPIDMGTSFLQSLKSFSTLKKQTKLVEKKQAYYKKQQTVLEDLKKAWENIAAYNQTKVAKDKYMETVSENMKIFADGGTVDNKTYSGFYQSKKDETSDKPIGLSYLAVWDLYDTQPYLGYSYEIANENIDYITSEGDDSVEDYYKLYKGNDEVKAFDYYCEKYYDETYDLPEKDDFINQLSDFYATLSDVEEKKAQIENKREIGENDYRLRFYVNAMRGDYGVDDYSDEMVLLYTSYQKIKAMEIWSDEEVLNESIELKKESNKSGENDIENWCELAKKDFESEMYEFSNISSEFNNLAQEVQKIYNKSYNKVKNELSLISSQAAEYKSQLETAKTSLTDAIKKLESAKTKLNRDVATAKGEWDNIATDNAIQDTSLAKQDKAEIDQLDKYLNSENIDKLIRRLTNVLNKVSDALTEIEKYKYCGTYFGEINNVEKMCDIYGKDNKDEFLKLSAAKNELSSHTDNLIENKCSEGNVEYEWVRTQSTQPNLNYDKTALYSYLYSHFADVDDSSVKEEDHENGKDFYESIKNTSKDQADKEAPSAVNESSENKSDGESNGGGKDNSQTTEISKMSNLPSKSDKIKNTKETNNAKETFDTDVDSGASSASGALDDMFGDGFLDAIADFGEDLRDNLYISEYIMGMFSYDTIEKEYIREQKDKGNSITKVENGDIKSITKCDITAANNYAYGNEIEYIIYGGDYAVNKAKAYASIFGIRFGFNVVYAFATSKIRDSALAVATPISAATLGVIPVPLIQAAIIIGMACCESAIDLDAISQGEKVPLYKTDKTWRCSIRGLTQLAKEKAGELVKETSEKVIDKSVDKLNEFLNMTNDELDGMLNNYTEDINKAIVGVYDVVITENAEVAIQQLTTYINTAVESTLCLEGEEIYATKKAQMIAWVKQELTAWGAQFTGDDIVSVVKREAVNVIVSNSDECINELFDLVEKSIKQSNYGKTIEDIINKTTTEEGLDCFGGGVMEQIKVIRNKITEKVINANEKVKNYLDDMTTDISNDASGGAEKLKKTVNGYIDGIFGSGENSIGNQNGNEIGAASFFSFGYSDYLRLFLLIGTFANEEKILLRTADVIQVNMAKCIAKDDSYLLSNSAAYVTLNATVQVKPTLLALPLFSDVENNPITKSNWYTIKYSSVAGY